MNKKYLKICLPLLVVALIVAYLLFVKMNSHYMCFDSNCFRLECAETEAKRERGLMFRDVLDEKSGMLFIFQKDGIYNFWMKNTKISLDIIWLNKNYEIVHVEKSAQPCQAEPCKSYKPNESARYVLELRGGMAEKIGLKLGDKAVRKYWLSF